MASRVITQQVLDDARSAPASYPANLPVYLTPAIYDAALAQGIDLKGYARTGPIPVGNASIWIMRNGR